MAEESSRERRDGPAGGLPALLGTLRALRGRTGLLDGARLLLEMNQEGAFDCPGCAWPEPGERSALEFCESGARHLAQEATRRRADPEFFARWPLSRLREQPDHWLEAQGRLSHPMFLPRRADRYEPISWDEAFARIAQALAALDSPDEAVFYTSGRTSNEAAFLYQLFVREFGTNNLPDCSNMCHESSSTALSEVIGVGKGTVSLDDFDHADAILLVGQNPGSNHPRMFNTLLRAKRRGCRVVSINPLREQSLVSFAHPKEPRGLLGRGTPIADLHLPVRVGGDVALLQGIMKELLEAEDRAPRRVLDHAFIQRHTTGFEQLAEHLRRLSWDDLVEESGISRQEMRRAAQLYAEAERVIACWAMGLTQHRHAVANVQEIVNLLLLRGNLGRTGAGLCPVRGHSNVQGDRTMGIWERPRPDFLARLEREFGFAPPAHHGLDTVGAIQAMHEGRLRVFVGMGGNFAVATPDAAYTHAALRRCALTAQVSTVLNRSHLVTGAEALILPCLARSERDVQASGPQFVTVENSMSVVHRSQGTRLPASEQLRSEPAIVAGLARAVLGPGSRVPWEELVADYDHIRERIARVVVGCEDMNRRVRQPGGFVLPNGARTREFPTPDGKAHFTVHELPRQHPGPGRFLLTTVRSHEQFNTTIYGLDDRYRGVTGDRRVLFLHADDIAGAGLAEGQQVDVTSHFADGTRTVRGFRVLAFELPRGCAAAYFPEANPLVPVESFAEKSRTPTYKSVVVSVAPSAD